MSPRPAIIKEIAGSPQKKLIREDNLYLGYVLAAWLWMNWICRDRVGWPALPQTVVLNAGLKHNGCIRDLIRVFIILRVYSDISVPSVAITPLSETIH